MLFLIEIVNLDLQFNKIFRVKVWLSSSPFAKSEQDIRLCTNVLDRRGPGSDLPPEDVVEDVDGVLLPLEVDPVKVRQDQEQQAGIIGLL